MYSQHKSQLLLQKGLSGWVGVGDRGEGVRLFKAGYLVDGSGRSCQTDPLSQPCAIAVRSNHVERRVQERKHGALRPQKPLRLIRDGQVGGGGGFRNFISNTYSLNCHHQNDSA